MLAALLDRDGSLLAPSLMQRSPLGICRTVPTRASPLSGSLPEFMDFKVVGWAILVVNNKFRPAFSNPLQKRGG